MKNSILFIYLIITVFLYVLNFELFNTFATVDLGFANVTIMPTIAMIVIGLACLLLLMYYYKNKEMSTNHVISKLNDQIKLMAKDTEIMLLKNANTS